MQILYDKLKSNPVIYVTRDIERALGINPDTEGYFIISNNTDFAKHVAEGKKNILLAQDNRLNSTADLLKSDFVKAFINEIENPSILVFKTTPQIEKICAENNWKLLNPPAEVSSKIEEKISQVKVFESLKDLFLKYEVAKCKDINWNGEKFILQFNYSHTGSGTVLIDKKEKLDELKEKFPEREARISNFIEGPLFTNNNAISGEDLLIGNVSYQITGLKYFADRPFSTIGNDFGLAKKLLTPTNLEYFKLIVKSAAEELKKLGWKGLFGVDVVMDEKTGKMYLIEVNARQPASTTFESYLQNKLEDERINVFEAHLAGLLGLNFSMEELIPIDSGSQIIKRITKDGDLSCNSAEIIKKLEEMGNKVIPYNNKNIGSELLRIQNDGSFMEDHNKLSVLGKKVLSIIHPDIFGLSESTQNLITSYLALEVGNTFISIPYFNNARTKSRGGLKVYTGKGSPKEIDEEITILSKKKQVDLAKMDKEQIKKFLVDNNIGIDCSGFVYYVLDAELKSKKDLHLHSVIKFPTIKNPIKKIIAKLRPAQNTSVLTFAQNENSSSISLQNARPGDFIVMIDSGLKNDRNHIVIITGINYQKVPCSGDSDNLTIKKITYAHSFAWSKDGKYNHGVRTGEIEITDPDAGLLAQNWIEQDKSGNENETYMRAKQAKVLDIRRVNALA